MEDRDRIVCSSTKIDNTKEKIAYVCYFIAFVIQTINFVKTGSNFHNYNFGLHFLSGIIVSLGASEEIKEEQTFNNKLAYIFVDPFFFFPFSMIAFIVLGIVFGIFAKILGYA